MDKTNLSLLVILGMLAIIFAIIFWEWRRSDKPAKEILDAWHNDPNNWKLGMFYYNKADKRLFPPKRLRYTGWTVNFANPYSIVILVVMILIPAVLVYYLKHHL